MHRRDFLKISAAACVGSSLLGCSREPDDGIMGLALIGCGRQGRDLTTNFLGVAEDYGARYLAVCDVDINRANLAREMILKHYAEQGIEQDVKVYQHPEVLLRNRFVDACVVAVPDHNHASVALQVIRAGCDLYLEKPITFTVKEGQSLVKAVRKRRAVFQAGTQQRSSLYFRRVCEIARQGRLGTLQHVEVRLPRDGGYADFEEMNIPRNLDYNRWLGKHPPMHYTEKRVHPQLDFSRPGWMQVEDFCYGMITNWGSHMIDIAQWGSGNELSGPVKVKAQSTYEDRGIWTVHTKIEGVLEYGNGLTMELVSLSGDDSRKPGVKFIGSDGWADATRGGFTAHDREVLRWKPDPGEEILKVSTHHHRDFLESIQTRSDPVAPVDQAHRSNTVCLLLAKAAKSGKTIQWDPRRERMI